MTHTAHERRANHGPRAAQRNRVALVRAAREVFAERGLEAPLYEVARRAGVGQGTLYRHFPDRTALVIAVFDENVAGLEELAAHEDVSLRQLLEAVAALALESSAFMDAVSSRADEPRLVALARRVQDLLVRPVDEARSAGTLACDITAEDVMLGIAMLSNALARVPATDRVRTSERWRALLWRAWTAPADPAP